jgi:hypothetical protein
MVDRRIPSADAASYAQFSLRFRPETGRPLGELAEVLLRGPGTLTRGADLRSLLLATAGAHSVHDRDGDRRNRFS